jgi:hypothetical protein
MAILNVKRSRIGWSMRHSWPSSAITYHSNPTIGLPVLIRVSFIFTDRRWCISWMSSNVFSSTTIRIESNQSTSIMCFCEIGYRSVNLPLKPIGVTFYCFYNINSICERKAMPEIKQIAKRIKFFEIGRDIIFHWHKLKTINSILIMVTIRTTNSQSKIWSCSNPSFQWLFVISCDSWYNSEKSECRSSYLRDFFSLILVPVRYRRNERIQDFPVLLSVRDFTFVSSHNEASKAQKTR